MLIWNPNHKPLLASEGKYEKILILELPQKRKKIRMTTPKPKLDLFNESPFLVSKKCRTSTPSLRPPKPPTKSSKHLRRSNNNSFNIIPPDNLFPNNNNNNFIINNNNDFANFSSLNNNNCNNNHNFFIEEDEFNLMNSDDQNDFIQHQQQFEFINTSNTSDDNQHPLIDSTFSRMSQQFEIISKIGSGYFADVYKVKSLVDNQYYAIKKTSIPFTSKSDRLRKLQEVKNHQSVPPHPNCVKYYDSWEEDGYLYIQTELCKTSLNEILETTEERKLPEHLVWSYLLDLLLAVKHLHDNQLLHLDIKPDNIFISFEDVAKLGDFGLMCNCLDLNSSHQYQQRIQQQQNQNVSNTSNHHISNQQPPNNRSNRLATIRDDSICILDDDTAHHRLINVDNDIIFDNDDTFSFPNDHDDSGIINRSEESIDSLDEGDSKYLASETMQGKFTKAADIFCLGITMFEVASGLDLPQRGEVYHKLRHNEIEDLYFNGLSADLVRVIKMMMEEDYTKRPTVDELLQLDAIKIRRLSQTRSPSSSSSSSVSSSTSS